MFLKLLIGSYLGIHIIGCWVMMVLQLYNKIWLLSEVDLLGESRLSKTAGLYAVDFVFGYCH